MRISGTLEESQNLLCAAEEVLIPGPHGSRVEHPGGRLFPDLNLGHLALRVVSTNFVILYEPRSL